jgi:hypothetical protein
MRLNFNHLIRVVSLTVAPAIVSLIPSQGAMAQNASQAQVNSMLSTVHLQPSSTVLFSLIIPKTLIQGSLSLVQVHQP